MTETIESMLGKLKSVVEHGHSEEYEGVRQERGLRMLVFGKPGSGKVRHSGGGDCPLIYAGDVERTVSSSRSERMPMVRC
jgi:adenylate kinase